MAINQSSIVGNLSSFTEGDLKGVKGFKGDKGFAATYVSSGYTSGGALPETNIIDSFPFSTPFTTAGDVGDLSQARRSAAGHQG